jgi:hypothetical protein
VASRASSGLSAAGRADDGEDPNHVTQIHEIAPKQTLTRAVSSLLPRRLSRAQPPQRSLVPSTPVGANMVVGVSVNTVENEHPEEDESASGRDGSPSPRMPHHAGAVVHVGEAPPRALRSQSSRQSLNTQKRDWKAKAINFTRKFRPKSNSPETASPLGGSQSQ